MYKSLKENNRGISSIMGTVIFVSIMLLMVSMVGWMLNEFNNYNSASQKRSELEWEKESEEILIELIKLDTTTNTFNLTIRNAGGIAAHIDTIWLITESMHKSYPTQIILNPGELIEHTFTQTDETLDPNGEYIVKVVTRRGNIASIHYPMTIAIIGVQTIDIGPLRVNIDYDDVQYTSETQTTPIPAWEVPPGEELIFYIQIANTGSEPLTLLKYSLVYAIEYQSGMAGSAQKAWSYFIVDSTSTYPPSGVVAYDQETNPYILNPNPEGDWNEGGPPVIVKFSSQYLGDSDANKFPAQGGYYLISIGLYFDYQGYDMGVNIPFVAIRTIGL